jgi:hypothetical protein
VVLFVDDDQAWTKVNVRQRSRGPNRYYYQANPPYRVLLICRGFRLGQAKGRYIDTLIGLVRDKRGRYLKDTVKITCYRLLQNPHANYRKLSDVLAECPREPA